MFRTSQEPRVDIFFTTRSWDGTPYAAYPSAQPQVTVLKITVPPHTALAWHQHPMISAAYVLSGQLMVEKQVVCSM